MSEKRKIIGVTVKTPLSPSKLANNIANEVVDFIKSKTEQEKTVEITENGTVEILPDEGYMLSKVKATVNVSASGDNRFVQLLNGSITEVTAEDLKGITTLKKGAFYNALNLSKVVLPEGLTNIETQAFTHYQNIYVDREYYIPLSLTQTGSAVFDHPPRTATVYYKGNLSNWLSINFGSGGSPLEAKSSGGGAHLYINNDELVQGNITIPDDVTVIPCGAFTYLSDIADVNTNKAQIIKRSAFSNSSVENVVFGSALTTFDDTFQFSDCTKLRTVRFNSTPTGLESRTFARSTNLTDISVPWAEGAVSGAPWGATNATIHYNTPISEGS